jgi:pimeloyl-ACP methyl ester carboxylesterase
VSIARIDALLRFDRRADLHRITAPTLVIAADNDYITPSYYGDALVKAIPGAELERLRGGGHSISKTRPETFNRVVMSFLQREVR